MRRLFTMLVCLLFTMNCFADCRSVIQNSKDSFMNHSEKGGQIIAASIGGTAGVAVFLALAPVSEVIVGALGAGAALGAGVYVAVKNGKRNRVIKLIDQANAYSKSNGKGVAGNLLRKLHRKVRKYTSDQYSMLQVADFIAESNRNGSLCPGNEFVPLNRIMRDAPASFVETI